MPSGKGVEIVIQPRHCSLAEMDFTSDVRSSMKGNDEPILLTGIANPAVIDLFAVDQKAAQVVLVMNEPRIWDGSDERLHQVQEKFNAYVSFLLDGEMVNAHPELAGKSARIELRSDHMPDDRAVELLDLIHHQLALQEITMEVIVGPQKCSHDCSCHDQASS